jgi:hypothetical protein
MPIRDDVWNDLIDMEPDELKNRTPLEVRWGGDAVVQELIEAGHLEPDGGRVLRTKTSVDAASLWEVLPEGGSSIGNQRALSELGWKSVRRFEAAKTLLVATGEIAVGRGRGGSIRRKLGVSSRPLWPNHRQPPSMSGRGCGEAMRCTAIGGTAMIVTMSRRIAARPLSPLGEAGLLTGDGCRCWEERRRRAIGSVVGQRLDLDCDGDGGVITAADLEWWLTLAPTLKSRAAALAHRGVECWLAVIDGSRRSDGSAQRHRPSIWYESRLIGTSEGVVSGPWRWYALTTRPGFRRAS